MKNPQTGLFEWEGKTYPGDTFTDIGNAQDINGNSVTKGGVEFNYNAATKKLSVTY